MKRIAICADDYALSLPISQGILALAENKRITSISCMTTSPLWREHATWLKSLLPNVEIGLHFTLTDLPLLHFSKPFSLPGILMQSHMRAIDAKRIQAELNAQFNAFSSALGQAPDFIDGHQHVHDLPIVREVLVSFLAEKKLDQKIWIRSALQKIQIARVKKTIIAWTGAKCLTQYLLIKNITHNRDFAGIYDFANYKNYPSYCQQFLHGLADQGLLMCHPAYLDPNDPIGHARACEWQFFQSDNFAELLDEAEVVLQPLNANISKPITTIGIDNN